MNIAEILEARARQSAGATAIIEAGRSVSFDALNRSAASIAAELTAAGVRPGARAVLLCPMSITLYETMIGLFRIGVTAVFVDPSAGRDRLDACVERVRPDLFIGIPKAHALRLGSAPIRSITEHFVVGGWVPFATRLTGETDGRGLQPLRCEPDTPAIITFTSGSTGQPKAALRTHGFLVAQHRALADSLKLTAGEIDLCTLPIFLLANLASGVTSVIPDADLRKPGAIRPERVLDQIERTGAARTVASPALLTRLAQADDRSGATLANLRRIYTGGAPVFPRTLDVLAEAAPDAAVIALYGSTEAEPIAEIDRREISAEDRAQMAAGNGLLAGRPVESIELRVLRDRWGTPLRETPNSLNEATLGPNETGEIVVSGAHVLPGYLDRQGDDETKIRVGGQTWHRTGDAGYLDDQRRLWLMGRCSTKAVDAAGVTYPFAVECAAMADPGIRRCAFVMHRGRRLLVVEPEANPDTLREAVKTRLTWARLDDVVIVERIPMDRRHNAKVEYPTLLRMLDEA